MGPIALGSPQVAAVRDTPVRTETLRAGPYTVAALFYSRPRPGSDLRLLVAPHAPAQSSATPIGVSGRALPGTGNRGAPVLARTAPDPELPNATAVEQPLPTLAAWLLVFDFDGPAGAATAQLPISVAAAGAIPLQIA